MRKSKNGKSQDTIPVADPGSAEKVRDMGSGRSHCDFTAI